MQSVSWWELSHKLWKRQQCFRIEFLLQFSWDLLANEFRQSQQRIGIADLGVKDGIL